MPRRRERGLCSELSRHGTRVWYYRDGHGPRIRVRGDFGSPEFNAALAEVFATSHAHVVTFHNHLQNRDAASTVYVARTFTSAVMPGPVPTTRSGVPSPLKSAITVRTPPVKFDWKTVCWDFTEPSEL